MRSPRMGSSGRTWITSGAAIIYVFEDISIRRSGENGRMNLLFEIDALEGESVADDGKRDKVVV